ncbi:MAG: copper chaperone CopZ [Saliniramus fredricksonii]|uniref:Copper chaperone n=1 Tax=Saliniramus fredricksonii TaxID=1653334 RepID=A0A0P8A9A5_9HYPH|nr:heavy-metal-associated domain-containing protein [Saliniramus fredricksonii]KPQ11685.1 MAG: copper chaperone CopZ [Saliniramus fredricksonii]SCC80238.1 copper chaperone [Saliniramus fredricksonii]
MSETSQISLAIEGMSCGGCLAAVERIVKKIDPQAVIRVDLDAGAAQLRTQAPVETVCAALDKGGFPAQARG